jgi:nucleotide-binding universal stress UspA family protein
MNLRTPVLCPIDFSEASAGALRYAVAVADHASTRVLVLTVEDPLLTEAVDLGTGIHWSPDATRKEMQEFARKTFGTDAPELRLLEYDVAVGKPAHEVLRTARERTCSLIVISTHGLTGIRKLFFGSTTERILRETTVPVLVTPPVDPGRLTADDVKRLIRRIVVPVDLSEASTYQADVAVSLARTLGVPVILVHVIEPLKSRLAARLHLAGVEANRRAVAEDGLADLVGAVPGGVHAEALVAYGDPAEELAKVARDRQAGLVVMGLHGSPLLGPRMGSVTYRLLCLHHGLVLALPPERTVEVTGEIPAAAAQGIVLASALLPALK